MSNSLIVLEYLKVVLSAPVLAAVVSLILAFMFKAEVRDLLRRAAHVKFPGGELTRIRLGANTLLERCATVLGFDVGNDDAGNLYERIQAHLPSQPAAPSDPGPLTEDEAARYAQREPG